MATTITIDLRQVARGLGISLRQVQAVVELLDEGNTVPFITRYRKDQTGGLNEEQIRQVQARLNKLRLLAERKQTILRSIESQGKLTEGLHRQILAAGTLKRLEDLYLPFKPRKQTLATLARSRGLEQLAAEIRAADPLCADLVARARDFESVDRKVSSAAEALLGAGHILAEQFSENVHLRQRLREILQRTGKFVCCQAPTIAERTQAAHGIGNTVQPARAAHSATDKATQHGPAGVSVQHGPVVAADSRGTADTGSAGPALCCPPDVESGQTGENGKAVATTQNERNTYTTVPPPIGDCGQNKQTAASPPATSADRLQAGADGSVGRQRLLPFMGEEGPSGGPQYPPVPDRHGAEPAGAMAMAPEQGRVSDPTVLPDQPGHATQSAGSDGAVLPDQAAHADGISPGASGGSGIVSSRSGDWADGLAAQTRGSPARLTKKELKKKRLEERRIKAFRDYFGYREEIRKIPPHRLLAINRGERAGILKVKLEYDLPAMYEVLDEMLVPAGHPHADYLRGCARDALCRLILPSLERETRRELTDRAEMHAVGVFAKNLRNLLLQPPVRDHRILAIDPGFKSGCKLVALDQFGNVLEHALICLVGKPERRRQAKEKIIDLVIRHQLTVIAIGNGTACRYTEDFVAELLDGELKGRGIAYVIVNEAGASAYSTSRIGREELPQYDASLRGAVSIGRRLLDPLSELVKIDPANIGVGLYQHDVKAKHLRASLDEVVESCVNFVGVDANTASPALLRYVSGLNQLTARRLYEYRCERGPFHSREQLRDVPGIGEATFVQAAGFLRISGGSNPLDATWIHPESYEVTNQLLARLGFTASDLSDKNRAAELAQRAATVDRAKLASELGVGAHTLEHILSQLVRPGRDPRDDFPQPVFKHGALKLEDLTPGMELTGTISNVVDFGAFVDIGMHDSGLVHVSHLSDRFVRDPHEVVAVGDIVQVWVLHVDKERRRVSLTMVRPGTRSQRRSVQSEGAACRQGDGKSGGSRSAGAEAAGADGPAQGSVMLPSAPPVAGTGTRPAAETARPQRGSGRSGESGRTAAPAGAARQAAAPQPSQRGARHARSSQQGRSTERVSYKPKPKPKPVVRITEAMRAGKEPMRTFGELLQFYTEKQRQQFASVEAPQQAKLAGSSGSLQRLEQQQRSEPAPEASAQQELVAGQPPGDVQAESAQHTEPAPSPVQDGACPATSVQGDAQATAVNLSSEPHEEPSGAAGAVAEAAASEGQSPQDSQGAFSADSGGSAASG